MARPHLADRLEVPVPPLDVLLGAGIDERVEEPHRRKRPHRLVVRPGADAQLVQALPGETRSRIDLALRRDVGMAHHVGRLDFGMALENALHQFDHESELVLGIVRVKADRVRRPVGGFALRHALGAVAVCLVDDLDADRHVVQLRLPLPVAVAGVPGALVERHELQDPAVAFDQAMGRHGHVGDGGKVRVRARIQPVAKKFRNVFTTVLARW
mgnify:CR=1 FL=1